MDESGDFINQERAEQQLKCAKTGLVSSHGNGDAISISLNSPSHRTGSSTYRVRPSGSDMLKSPIQPAVLNSGICSNKYPKRPEALRVASFQQELKSDLRFQEQFRTESIFKNSAAFDWSHRLHKNENLLNAQSATSQIRSSGDHLSSWVDQNDLYPAKKEESTPGFGNCRGTRNRERVNMNRSATKQADRFPQLNLFPQLNVLAEPSMYLQQEQPQQLNTSYRNSLPLSLSASRETLQARSKKGVAHNCLLKLPNIAETSTRHAPNIGEHHQLNNEVKDNFQLKLPTIPGATKFNAEKMLDLQESIGNQSHLQGLQKRRNTPKASCKTGTTKKRFEESDDCTSTGYPSGCSSTNSSIQDDDSSS